MLKYILADLIAWLLRPIVRAALLVLAIAFVINVPAQLWVLYVDPSAAAATLTTLNWAMGVLLVGFCLAGRVTPPLGVHVGAHVAGAPAGHIAALPRGRGMPTAALE